MTNPLTIIGPKPSPTKLKFHSIHIQIRHIPTLSSWTPYLINGLKCLLLSGKLNELLHFLDENHAEINPLIMALTHLGSIRFHFLKSRCLRKTIKFTLTQRNEQQLCTISLHSNHNNITWPRSILKCRGPKPIQETKVCNFKGYAQVH